MAILKPVQTPQGVVATYHKLLSANIDVSTQTVRLHVQIFASPEARESGSIPLWNEYQTIPFHALTQDPRDLLYPMLAHYGDSFLQGGITDEDGAGAPGNFTINLRPEALQPTVEPGHQSEEPSLPPPPTMPEEEVVDAQQS